MKTILFHHKRVVFLISTLIFNSCNQKVESKQGGLDLISNVYYDASENLDQAQHFHISKLNWKEGRIVELVPGILAPEITGQVYFIRNGKYVDAGNPETARTLVFDALLPSDKGQDVAHKKTGAVWVDIPIPDYEKRKNLTDTVLYGKRKFRRFEIETSGYYSRFYIYPTDTLLPYSLNSIADKEYNGRLERIDSYDKNKDLFTTMMLIPRNTWDYDAKSIFEFNDYAGRKK